MTHFFGSFLGSVKPHTKNIYKFTWQDWLYPIFKVRFYEIPYILRGYAAVYCQGAKWNSTISFCVPYCDMFYFKGSRSCVS